MIIYIAKRFISGLIVLFLFASILYFAVQIILPGDYASHYVLGLSIEESQGLRHELGLDLPLWQRYLHWLGQLFNGSFGRSFSLRGLERPVTEIMLQTLPSTILVFGLGTILAYLLGNWLGRFMVWKQPALLSGAITFTTILLYTSFPPWLAFILVYLLIDTFKILPDPSNANNLFWRTALLTKQETIDRLVISLLVVIAVFLLANAMLRHFTRRSLPSSIFLILSLGIWGGSWWVLDYAPHAIEVMKTATLPLLAYITLSFGEITLIMRTSMIDTLHEEYITLARAKGLNESAIRDRHAARNAILPVLNRLVITLPYLLTSMVMIEMTLNWNGIGLVLFNAYGLQNVNLALGMAILIGVISLVARLALEIIQVYLDPRLRLGVKGIPKMI
jgi:peptide/nickel transport system permease protein